MKTIRLRCQGETKQTMIQDYRAADKDTLALTAKQNSLKLQRNISVSSDNLSALVQIDSFIMAADILLYHAQQQNL